MSVSLIISSIVMFAALVGMIVCSKKQKTNPGAQPVAIALLIIVVISGSYILYKKNIFGGRNMEIIESENHYYASQGYVIGKFIKENISDANVLVIEGRDYEKSEREVGFVDAIKEGVGSDVKVVGLQPEKGSEEDIEADMGRITSQRFDEIIASNSSCNVIVLAVGLPNNASQMKFWRMSAASRPKLILASNVMGGGSIKLGNAVKQGAISAVVAISPNSDYDSGAPSNFEDAFKKRYILIDKSNIADNAKLLDF